MFFMNQPSQTAIASSQNRDLILSVLVRDRSGIVFEGQAEAVSSVNDKGPFDVLPLHANFISLIRQSLTISIQGEVRRELEIPGGVLTVKENKVEVYLGILH